jgi:putative methanogenesis marker protein 8
MCIKGEHEIYCCGSRVRISEHDGVEVLSEPLVEYCPLHEVLYGFNRIDRESVRKSVESKIAGFGFCCENRAFNAESVVAYGASEMMRVWLEEELIDCAVVVCEGAGTVVVDDDKLVQGIGARLTGIIRTSPIRDIIKRVEADGGFVLDKATARIDQLEGVKQAVDFGFKRVAVSVAGFQAEVISVLRRFEADAGVNVLIFSVCNTCVSSNDVKHIAQADIVCASASKILRKCIGGEALLQLGVTIPVYTLTEQGKELVLSYLARFNNRLVVFRTRRLPYVADGRGPRSRSPAANNQKP